MQQLINLQEKRGKVANPLLSLKTYTPFFKSRIPGQVVIQFTDACNATCAQCGMRASEKFKRSKLPVDTVKRMLDSCAENGVKSISLTGGEPFLYFDELVSHLKYAGDIGIEYSRTGTNGFFFMDSDRPGFETKIRRMAERLAKTKIYTFWISIDSADAELHERIRGLPGVIKGMRKALPIFHEYGIYPAANLGINRNTGGYVEELYHQNGLDEKRVYDLFRESFSRFYEFVIGLGFTMTNACYPMSISENASDLESVYGASGSDRMISFTRKEKKVLFKALFDTIPDFRERIRIFSPRISLYTLIKQYSGEEDRASACRGGIDFLFIDAKEGNTFPCGFRGNENMGKLWDIEWNTLKQKAFCKKCDWECFRDPSEMFEPFLLLFGRPFQFMKRYASDREYFRIWQEDLSYYKQCGYFNGRIPLKAKSMVS